MPLALRDLQSAFVAHLAGTDRIDLAGEVLGDTIPAAARLRVYRHHVRESLSTALATTFPTVQAVVGADFFRQMARDFVGQSLPEQPVLAEYGASFAAFVDGYEAARRLPYLGDVARLDWALNHAFHVPTSGRLAVADLAAIAADQLTALRLVLAPGSTVISSCYPLDRIWAISQPGAATETVDLDGGGAHLLVLRRPDDAAFVDLSAAEATFLGCVAGQASLEEAVTAAATIDPAFDLATSFARLLALGTFAALQ